jgi:alkylation response protein AidB-like acyl-CoA dehydrogenase
MDTLIAEVTARRDEFDQLGHVPRDIVATMKKAGIFRSGTPRKFGGEALAPAPFLAMVERISKADGSAGWVAAFGSANTYLAALPIETQRKIYASGPDQVYAGGLYPLQEAKAVPGGWKSPGAGTSPAAARAQTGSAWVSGHQRPGRRHAKARAHGRDAGV